MRGAGGIQRTVMLPLPYWQTLQYFQGQLNLSEFIRRAWYEDRHSMRRDWPTGMTSANVPLKRTTVSLDRGTADDMDAVRNAMPGFNFSRWVARALTERMREQFPNLGY
jgi:hypothetical protein